MDRKQFEHNQGPAFGMVKDKDRKQFEHNQAPAFGMVKAKGF